MKKKLYGLFSLILILTFFLAGCSKVGTDADCVLACSEIVPADNAPEISSLELEAGMYYAHLDEKKKGTPDDWIHILEGSKSSSWRSPEAGKNYKCDCDILNFYECPNREHIDCMPIVSKENQPYCEANYRQWIEENCDVYYTD